MLLGTSAYAQIAVGAGYAQSKHTLAGKKGTTSSPTNGFYAGIDYNVPVGEIFGLSAGVNYEYLMSKTYSLSSILSGDIKEQYINVPVRINAGFDLSDDVRLFLFGGPTFSMPSPEWSTPVPAPMTSTSITITSASTCWSEVVPVST